MANEITSTNVAQAIVKQVANAALPALVGNLVMGNLVNRDFEATLNQAGDTINVPIPPTLVANNIAEAGTVTNQGPNLGNAQIVLEWHREATFVLPDVTRALAVPDLIKTYMDPAVIAIAEAIETDLLLLYPLFTANAATGSQATITEAVVDSSESALFAAKVPANAQKYLITSGTAYGQLRQLPRFTEYQILGDPAASMAAMASGQIGRIKDFIVFRSQYVPKVSSTTRNLAFVRNAIGLAIRRLPLALPGTGVVQQYAELGNFGMRVTMSYQPNTLSQQFTVDVLYGCGVLRNNHGVEVDSN